MNKVIAGVILLFFCTGVLFSGVGAQAATISEKRELISKLLKVIKADETVKNVADQMLLQMENSYGQMVARVVPPPGVGTDEERNKIKKAVVESRRRFLKQFKGLYSERIDFELLKENVYFPLYDKYFTASDLEDLIAFYESPTGEKSINIMPQLMQEFIERSSIIVNPIIFGIFNELADGEKMRLLKFRQSVLN